ncbi:MAG: hypothetical protein KAJ40_07590 [Alphaproteobacteria bacterium]|nr:hypothetical protein [Alphaproteobacteria bacterium]
MKRKFLMRASCLLWTYSCTNGDNPIICFSNPKVSINVIYTLDDIAEMLARGDDQNGYTHIPYYVPYSVMKEAYDVMTAQLSTDTQTAMAA